MKLKSIFCLSIVSLLSLTPAFAADKVLVEHEVQIKAKSKTDAKQSSPVADKNASEDPIDPCFSLSQNDHAIDRAFDYLNTKFCQPAIWFDTFFVDDRVADDARAGTIIRWFNDFSFYEKEDFSYRANISARLNLPGVNKRLKLVLETSDEDDPFAPSKGPSAERETEVGLRYDWYAKGRSSFNIQANFNPKVEARWRYIYPLSENTITRFTQKLYQDKKVTGESSELDIEHSFNETFLARWSAVAQYESRGIGWELGSSIQLYQHISSKQAISYQAAIHSVDEPYYYIKDANVGLTYRQNFARDWLFFSVTPEYNWSKENAESERINQVIITLTLEILFHNV
ncbi:hypothetical protein L2729_02150 [Shewanella gelidimarina]|uniref:hypothetical protein n=1 Tax=Shewanella gelidimarina TaxID=56813 RepID=UPI00200FDD2A|nr:hypothetical protein [Shewanella gelidimarina]MCL1056792.1 hypothetical protein [Shewanella gelidimarina]